MLEFSIIITSYNRLEKLKRSLNSALSQTFQNYEIIVVDDFSSDGSIEFLKALQNKKIKSYFFDKNQGQAKATNYAINKTSGKWIAFLDADDYWTTNKLERFYETINNSPKETKLFYSSCIIVNSLGQVQRVNNASVDGYIYKKELLYNPIGCQSRVVVERTVLLKENGLDENLIATKDWDLWIRLTKQYKVKSIIESLTYYEENDESISSNLNSVLKGRNQLWAKHFPHGMSNSEKRVSFNLFGKFLLNRGHKTIARQYFIKSWINNPLILFPLFNYIISFIPINIVRYAFKLNNKYMRLK